MKRWINERGFSLLIVFFTIVLISILGIGILSISANSLNTSKNERIDQSVYYIAEAGLNQLKSEIEVEINTAYQVAVSQYNNRSEREQNNTFESYFFPEAERRLSAFTNTTYTINNFQKNFDQTPEANVTLIKTDNEYKIQSTGTIGKRSRKIEQAFEVGTSISGGESSNVVTKPPSGGVYYTGNINYSGNAEIIGNVYTHTLSVEECKIKFNGNQSKLCNILVQTEKIEYKLPSYPNKINELPSKTITASNNIILEKDSIITGLKSGDINITVPSGTTYLYVNEDLNAEKLNINVSGAGKLILVVNGNMNFSSKGNDKTAFTIKHSGGVDLIDIYAKGTVNLNGNDITHIHGSMYVTNPNASLNINHDTNIYGPLYLAGGNLHINGKASGTLSGIYAPNSNIHINGSANISTSIVAKDFTINGNATLNVGTFTQSPIIPSSPPKMNLMVLQPSIEVD